MSKHVRLCSLLAAAACSFSLAASQPSLPKVEILGKEYYYYEVKKGDSIYGIAKQFGWDINELIRLNPNTVSELKKGSRLYYPTGRVVEVVDDDDASAAPAAGGGEVASEPEATPPGPAEAEPIRHLVKKGETVYSISRQYNIPLEAIYASHPSAKQGIKAGETLVIRQDASSVPSDKKYAYYTIKRGDTLFALARQYNVTVADILKANPGVSESNFRAGDTVRIPTGQSTRSVKTRLVEEERLKNLDNYKVKKGDTWSSIAQKTGASEEKLKEANPDDAQPKKDDIVVVPNVETVSVEVEVDDTDPRELTAEGRQELYDSINNIDSDAARLTEVRVALLLDDPMGKKDLEFSRGFLLALDQMKSSPVKIEFKVLDGRASTQTVTDQLEEMEPNLIISTADKNFPAFLADFGNTNRVQVVNAFDVKNDLYTDNASMVQFLTPPAYFYEQMADYIAGNYGSRKFVYAGAPDSEDGIAEMLSARLESARPDVVENIADLANYDFTGADTYVIYASPTKKEEVADLLRILEHAAESNPMVAFTVVGRPNWITYEDAMGDKFAALNVIVPARFYFDEESPDGRTFVSGFDEAYGHQPLRSYPNFAATGYDMARYFIPFLSSSNGDFNREVAQRQHPVQSNIDLKRVSNWGGFFNPDGYILSYGPSGVEKIIVR